MTLPEALARVDRMIVDAEEGIEDSLEQVDLAMQHGLEDGVKLYARDAAREAQDAHALRTLRDVLPSQKDMEAMNDWLDYGQGELGKSHRGYFSAGGWPYEQLKALHARLLSAYEVTPLRR
jgi:hypothetical protein